MIKEIKAQVITNVTVEPSNSVPACLLRRETPSPFWDEQKKRFRYITKTFKCNYYDIDGVQTLVDESAQFEKSIVEVSLSDLDDLSNMLTYPDGLNYTERRQWELEQILLLDTQTGFLQDPENPKTFKCLLPENWEILD